MLPRDEDAPYYTLNCVNDLDEGDEEMVRSGYPFQDGREGQNGLSFVARMGTLWIFRCNGFTKADFITWDNFDELLISASLEIKEGAVECYHSSSRWL